MSALDPELWRKLSPYLDRALDLTEAERPAWLGTLRSEDPVLAEQVEALLEELESLGRAGFLEGGSPAMLPGQPARAGEMTGAYRLIEPIGHGGMGTVWLAERSDGRFDRHVAVKFPNVSLSGSSVRVRSSRGSPTRALPSSWTPASRNPVSPFSFSSTSKASQSTAIATIAR